MPVVMIDHAGFITFANMPARQVMLTELEGTPLGAFLRDTAGEDPWCGSVDRTWHCPQPMQFHCPKGGKRAVQVYVTTLAASDDTHDGLFVYFDDDAWAHEPANLLARVKQHEDRIALATLAAHIGVFDRVLMSDDPTPPYWSPSMRTMLDYPAHAPADPEWFFSRVHEDDRPEMLAAISRAEDPAREGWVEVGVRWHHPDGTVRFLLLRSSLLFETPLHARGRVRAIGVVMDMTDRQQTEAHLRLRSEILDETPDLVAITTAGGRLEYLNRAGRQMVGIGSEAPLGDVEFRNWFAPESLQTLLGKTVAAATSVGVATSDVEFIREDGAHVPMSQVLLAHRRGSEEVSHFSVISRDLTRERDLEAKFLQSQKMEALGRLAGGVAHDFNNMLSIVLGSTELALAELEPQGRARRYLQNILDASDRAASLTGQLLAFSRKQIMQPKVTDVGLLLQEVAPLLQRLLDDNIQVSPRGPRSASMATSSSRCS